MKNSHSIFLLFALGLGVPGTHTPRWESSTAIANGISCGPDPSSKIETTSSGKYIIPLPGWGAHSYHISAANDSTQFFFDQGLNMYYSYHMKEAAASFKEAARFTPSSPMVYWGQALAMGPTYNFNHLYNPSADIPQILRQMNEASGYATEKEKQLIAVMNRRYLTTTPGTTTPNNRKARDSAYALGMKELTTLYPDDQDIASLYIDAIMLLHPWDFWNNDGSPKTWTPEAVALCEKVLKANPHHPAALHYYIHLTEASRHPEIALASADSLKQLLPGVAHMVHMSSHEYERNGLYASGVDANDSADDNLLQYDSLAKNLSLVKHSPHYFAVQTYCGLSGGMYAKSMQDAQRCRGSVAPDPTSTYEQYLYMMPAMALIRLGKWKEILNDNKEPDAQWPYARLLYHFAKGLALVYTDQPDSATQRLSLLRTAAKDPVLTARRIPFNSPLQCAGIAEDILNAAILYSQKKYAKAITSLEAAIRIEDNLIYTEPKDWPIPARQFLGAYLLRMGKPEEAEKVYREDIAWNPGNGWSLLGLCQSLKAQGITKDLAGYEAAYHRSFSHADQIPPASVYMNQIP